MKQILIGVVLLTFIGCAEADFCGHPINEEKISNLKGKVEGDGLTVGMQLSFAATKEFGDNSKLKFGIDYAVEDTLVINVVNYSDEKAAKKISCIVAENSIAKETEVVYVRYIEDDKIKAIQIDDSKDK